MNWDEVRELGLALPETEASTSYGTPALKVRGKGFARLRESGGVLVVKVDFEERLALLHAEPDTFFVTPHYQDYPCVLVRLPSVDPVELHELLVEAWRMTAPKRLVAAYDAEHPQPVE